jgi:REP element-mobilizing transposase RayT
VFYRRRLPHLHAIGIPVFLTWRLHGSLPKNRWFDPHLTAGQSFVAMDKLLDHAESGPRYLAIPEIADMVATSIHYRDPKHYSLHSYVVMPNHVHLLITPNVEVPTLTHSLKRYTARQANLTLRLTGKTFWQDESYDHLVRNQEEFRRITKYIETNPVVAGLVPEADQYRWSSVGQDEILRADCQSAPLLIRELSRNRIMRPPDRTTPATPRLRKRAELRNHHVFRRIHPDILPINPDRLKRMILARK